MSSTAERSPRSERRQMTDDSRMLREALRDHGDHAAARLRVMLEWAREDETDAIRQGDPTRAAMKRARAERIMRVIARLDTGDDGWA